MINLIKDGVFYHDGKLLTRDEYKAKNKDQDIDEARKKTISYGILSSHNVSGDDKHLNIKFDSLASHDITYVGIIQTAKASGLETFPIPYVLTNCHNSLCAVGGTINEDDHVFGLTAAKHFGGIYVPPHMAVIHQYIREMMAGCGRMILGSDSHTRYGALGTMAIGEGGGELVKQLLEQTYDVDYPEIIAVYLEGKPAIGVGPQDIALAIIREVFRTGFVKNKVMEFIGPGISSMSCDYRIGIDVMTTETTCLSSIWQTDENTLDYLRIHGRSDDYKKLEAGDGAYYDGAVVVDLSTVKPMIALPFHPSNAYEIDELNANLKDITRAIDEDVRNRFPDSTFSLSSKIVDGRLKVDQAIIAGCAGGTYSNLYAAWQIMKDANIGNDIFDMSVYPSSVPLYMDLNKKGILSDFMSAGAIVKTAFCGPCFGAGDTPANDTLSIRHTTRNFPNREGSKPGSGQLSGVALMDARSIAATARNKGLLTSASEYAVEYVEEAYFFDSKPYDNRVYFGYNVARKDESIKYGPNIKDWPQMPQLSEHVLLKVCSVITDSVTTTDELIPSGETSSYRSNPLGLAEYTLSKRDPNYVPSAKEINSDAVHFNENHDIMEVSADTASAIKIITDRLGVDVSDIEIGSTIYARCPGDGSAREQAASCQRVLGGLANISQSYATKRYRSNVINWGMLPFIYKSEPNFEVGDFIFVPNVKSIISSDKLEFVAYIVSANGLRQINLTIDNLTVHEKEIIISGCLINYNKKR